MRVFCGAAVVLLACLLAISLAGSGNTDVEQKQPEAAAKLAGQETKGVDEDNRNQGMPPPPPDSAVVDDEGFEVAEGEPISVKLTNRGDVKVKVFWISHSGEAVPNGIVAPGGGLALNSFVGHRFRLDTRGKSEDIVIRGNRRNYEVGDTDANNEPEDEEQIRRDEEEATVGSVNSFATALPVKFRNLCGRELSLWYDDGSGPGQLQAYIGPNGVDSTTNSYPTHKFCFAEKGDERGCRASVCKAQVVHEVYTYICDDGSGSAQRLRCRAARRGDSASRVRESRDRHTHAH